MKFKHRIKQLFSFIVLKIKAGPLAGKKWIATTGYSFVKGSFENYKTECFVENFQKGSVLYDIGAHVGYFAAIASSINDGSGHVFAFEPRPMNANFFLKHMEMNGFKNVTLFRAAVATSDGEARFNANTGSATGHLSPQGNIVVKVVNVDHEFESGRLPAPDFIKIDVEGGEIEVLKSCHRAIVKCRPKLLIATHGSTAHRFVIDYLVENNYQYKILNPDHIKGDEEIMALPR